MSKIDTNECMLYAGFKSPTGYGYAFGTQAHRVMYENFNGELIDGMQIDHLCRERSCINPDHLEQVTPKINTHRSKFTLAFINAQKTECVRGHEYTKENTYINNVKTVTGLKQYRSCLTCKNESGRKARAKIRLRIKLQNA